MHMHIRARTHTCAWHVCIYIYIYKRVYTSAAANFEDLSAQKFNADNQVKKYREDLRLLETQKIQMDVLAFDTIINRVARRDDNMVAEAMQAARDRGNRIAAADTAGIFLRVPASPAASPQPVDGGSDVRLHAR